MAPMGPVGPRPHGVRGARGPWAQAEPMGPTRSLRAQGGPRAQSGALARPRSWAQGPRAQGPTEGPMPQAGRREHGGPGMGPARLLVSRGSHRGPRGTCGAILPQIDRTCMQAILKMVITTSVSQGAKRSDTTAYLLCQAMPPPRQGIVGMRWGLVYVIC